MQMHWVKGGIVPMEEKIQWVDTSCVLLAHSVPRDMQWDIQGGP